MTFLIRQISRTADGREIVREFPHDADVIFVGRAAACEVHLPDLAVELNHASITLLNNGTLEIASLGGLGFEVDGRRVNQANVNPAAGAELRFGSHVLNIATQDGVAAITVARVDAASELDDDKDETRLFTLKGLLPGRRVSAWALLICVLAAFLAWPLHSIYTYQNTKKADATFHADTLWSSGALSSAHAGLKNDCKACHIKPFVAVEDSSCVACHADIHGHADPKRLLIGKAPLNWQGKMSRQIANTFNRPEGRCVECHTEHEGAGPMEDTKQEFCSGCHADLNTRLTDTKIANAGDFSNAHPQFKPRVMTMPGINPQSERISLDLHPVDDNGLKFSHGMHLSTGNGVARMAQSLGKKYGFGQALDCKDCHTKTADGVRFQPIEMETNCAMCHSLAVERIGDTVRTLRHGDPKMVVADLRSFYRSGGPFRARTQQVIEGRRRPGDYGSSQRYYAYFGSVNYGQADSAIRAVFSRGGACYDCHVISAPPAGSDNWGVGKVYQTMRYMEKGWFDHGAHKTETCASCHNAAKSTLASDLLLPGIKTCRNCHGGESSHADVPSSCAMCHSYHADASAPWMPRGNEKKKKQSISAIVTPQRN